MQSNIEPVPLLKAYRLINHGPTVLVSATHGGINDVMAVAWCCGLDLDPPKLTIVLDKASRTRALVEESGRFAVQVPVAAQVNLTREVGSRSLHDDPNKLKRAGVRLFDIEDARLPFVAGCAAWLSCRVVPEAHNQATYDLFIGEVVAAWADPRVFRDGYWRFETAAAELRTTHHVAGGHFYAIGDVLPAKSGQG